MVVGGFTVASSSSSSVPGSSPPKGGGTGSFLLLFLATLPPLVGRTEQARSYSRSSSFSSLASPRWGGPESFSPPLSHLGEALLPPDPHPIGWAAKAARPPLVVLAASRSERMLVVSSHVSPPLEAAVRASSSILASLAALGVVRLFWIPW